MTWLRRHAPVIEAGAAVVTALVAAIALIGVKLQLDAADAVQRAQSARDAYRAHLVLSVEHPAFNDPVDACALMASEQGAAYGAFVDHLLYSAEQMLTTADGWAETFADQLAPHATYLCSDLTDWGASAPLDQLLQDFRAQTCPVTPHCAR